MKCAVIDTETTGLIPGEAVVIEFAVVCLDGLNEVDRWVTKIKPTEDEIKRAHPKALSINGYTPEAWADAPSLLEVAPDILSRLEGRVLVGHNVAFDEQILKAHFASHGIREKIPFRKIDTQVLVWEHLFPLGLNHAALDSVREFLGWSKDGAHTAMKDVEDTLKLFRLTWRMAPWRKLLLLLKLKFGLPV